MYSYLCRPHNENSTVAATKLREVQIELSKQSTEIYSSEFEISVGKAMLEIQLEEIDILTIDFRNINYVDIVAIINISAFIENIKEVRPYSEIKIHLPENENIQLFFRQWKVYDAFAKSAKVFSFEELLDNRSLKIYNSNLLKNESEKGMIVNPNLYGDISDQNEINSKYHNLCYQKFFGVKSFDLQNPVNNTIDTGIINEEVSRWDIGDIKEVLNFTLRDVDGNKKEGYIPSNVIFECLTNALRHPNGNLMQVASRHIDRNILKNANSPHFTLVFWDNGTSMIDVLKEGYNINSTVRAMLPNNNELSYPHFQVKLQDNNSDLFTTWVDSRLGPDEKYMPSYYDYYWFLATFFPGVSSDPKGLTRLNNPGVKPTQSGDSSIFHNPGMGLYLLLNTVIDVFGGKINVRSGEFLMSLQKPTETKKKKYEYAATIKKLSSPIPKFNGNLIAIHLPLWKK